jgi:2-keto-3-deoxy-L-rhamnonate aldolase RhmA
MTTRSLRDELSTGRTLLGAWLQTPNPVSAEAAGLAGFDWVGIDTQHGLIGYDTLVHMLQAVAISGTPTVVRVSGNIPGEIGRALDSGAQGVVGRPAPAAEVDRSQAPRTRGEDRGGLPQRRPLVRHPSSHP